MTKIIGEWSGLIYFRYAKPKRMKNLMNLTAFLFISSRLRPCEKPNRTRVVACPVPMQVGQSAVQDDEPAKDIAQTAMGSPDHKPLVAALKAAEYVDVRSNARSFTVLQRLTKVPPPSRLSC